jgi:hypothetical protein
MSEENNEIFDLSKFKNFSKVFIETGFQLGSNLEIAVDLEFEKIYGIEANINYCNKADILFEDDDNVDIINGDSIDKFPELLKTINTKCILYLDTHFDEELFKTKAIKKWTAIRDELNYLKTHPIKDNIIIIPNWSCHDNTHIDEKMNIETYLGHKVTLKKLKKINKNFLFKLLKDNDMNDILIACTQEVFNTL